MFKKIKKKQKKLKSSKGEDWNIVSGNVLIVQMSDPFQACLESSLAWIGICKSLLTIENSINSTFPSLLARYFASWHRENIFLVERITHAHSQKPFLPFIFYAFAEKLDKEMLNNMKRKNCFW